MTRFLHLTPLTPKTEKFDPPPNFCIKISRYLQIRIIRTVSSKWEMRSDFSFCMKSWMRTHKNRRDRILPIRVPPDDVLFVFGVFGVLFSLPVFKGRLPFCAFIKPLDLRQKDSGQCFHLKSWNPGPVIMVFLVRHSPVLSPNVWLILFPFLKIKNAAALQAPAWCLIRL